MDTDLQEARIELGVLAPGEDEIARQHHVHAGTDGCAVHGGDGGQRCVSDTEESVVDRLHLFRVRAGHQVVEIGTSAKAATGAGQYDRADALVGLPCVERRTDLVVHGERDRVALVGIV